MHSTFIAHKRILDGKQHVEILKGKIDHSTAGAQQIGKSLAKYGKNRAGRAELCGQILALCISRLSLVGKAHE